MNEGIYILAGRVSKPIYIAKRNWFKGNHGSKSINSDDHIFSKVFNFWYRKMENCLTIFSILFLSPDSYNIDLFILAKVYRSELSTL